VVGSIEVEVDIMEIMIMIIIMGIGIMVIVIGIHIIARIMTIIRIREEVMMINNIL